MKILHIATLGAGGAAEAARRIHRGVLAAGFDSRLLFLVPGGRNEAAESIYPRGLGRLWRRIGQKIDPRNPIVRHKRLITGADLEFDEAFTSVRSDVRLTSSPEYRECDLVHFHWTGNFLDWPSFFAVNRKPVLWSLCDLNPLTGGCHYSRGCVRFKEMPPCVACPLLRGSADPGLAEEAMKEKGAAEASRDWELVFLPPSEWMKENVRASRLFSHARCEVLPHPGEDSTYRWRSESSCRERLGIDPERPTLLFVGDGRSRRKGYRMLAEALQSFPEDCFQLLLVGDFEGIPLPRNATLFGRVEDAEMLATLYGAASMIAIPSSEENLALVFIDSQMCGTPAIVFEVGGLTEHLVDGRNGLLAGPPSVGNLSAALRRWLGGATRFDRAAIAEQAAERFSWRALGPKYVDLYREMAGGQADAE